MPLPKQPKVLGDTVGGTKLNKSNKLVNSPIVENIQKLEVNASPIQTLPNPVNNLEHTPNIINEQSEKSKFNLKSTTKAKPKNNINISSDSNKITINTSSTLVKKPVSNKHKHTNKVTKKKLFVLDTNVLLHDPSSLFRFAENDVYLPMVVLEELDNHKKGLSEVAKNARTISRTLDDLLAKKPNLEHGIPLNTTGHIECTGCLYFQTQELNVSEIKGFVNTKADNYILSIVNALREYFKDKDVILVSKDINMRIKANALNIPAEEYYSDHVLDDMDLLYSGYMSLPANFWLKHSKGMESWPNPKTGSTYYRLQGPLISTFFVNQMVYLDLQDGSLPFYGQVIEISHKTATIQTLIDYSHQKNKIWGITARNKEQNFALNLLMNPNIDFVTLLGQAGTGKTLLALACALEQVIEHKTYNQIIVTRATVPLGDDIGFLPGTEEEKMQPWMGAIDDNLEVLQHSDGVSGDYARINLELLRSKIKIKSMSFMRGRTFVNKYIIIDEAQNLTPKQMKALITRAGHGTKIICMGNIAQIDTPYLTEGSSGLTYVVDRFKGWENGGHITLARGERSRLAEHAGDVL